MGKCKVQEGVGEERPGVQTERDCRTQCTIANSAALRVHEQGGTRCDGISWNDQPGAVGNRCVIHKNQKILANDQSAPSSEATWKCEKLEVRDAGAQHEQKEAQHEEKKQGLEKASTWFKPHLILNAGHMAKRHRVQKSVTGDCFTPFTWIEVEGGQSVGRRLAVQQTLTPGIDWLYDGGLPRLADVGKDQNAIPLAEAEFNTILNKLPKTEVQGVDIGAYVTTDRICLDGTQAGYCIQRQKDGRGWIWKYVTLALGITIGMLLYRFCCLLQKKKYYQVQVKEVPYTARQGQDLTKTQAWFTAAADWSAHPAE